MLFGKNYPILSFLADPGKARGCSFHYYLLQEAQKRLWTCLNGAKP